MKRPLLLMLFLAVAAGSVSAQQRRPPPSEPEKADKAEKPGECGAMPKDWSGEAYALDGITLGGVGLKPQIRLWGCRLANSATSKLAWRP